MTEKELENAIKHEDKLTANFDRKLDDIIKRLTVNQVDKYDVSDLFTDAYHLCEPENVDCDTLTPLLDYQIEYGDDLITTLEDDLGALDDYNLDDDKPVPDEIAEKAGDIGNESPAKRENKLAFVNNNFLRGLNWYIEGENGNLSFLDKKSAISAVEDFKSSARVFES